MSTSSTETTTTSEVIDFICGICHESEEKYIETPCGHKFHSLCLKSVARPKCPLCTMDITLFLIKHGITQQEINNRIHNDDLRVCCQGLEDVDPRELSREEFKTVAIVSLRESTDWAIVYRDLMLDLIANAAHLFVRISELKHVKEAGVFVYLISVVNFIAQMSDPHSKSVARWCPESELAGTQFHSAVKALTNRIENPKTDFGVLIMFEYELDGKQRSLHPCPRLMSVDPAMNRKIAANMQGGYVSGINSHRIAQRDILKTMMRVTTCRCSGATVIDQNREYTWAKTYLKRLIRK